MRSRKVVAAVAAAAFTVGLLSACTPGSPVPAGPADPAPTATPYASGGGTKSTAYSHPANPVISKMWYHTEGGETRLVVPITTTAAGDQDEARATLDIYGSLNAMRTSQKPIFTDSVEVATGDSEKVEFAIPEDVVATLRDAGPAVANQLVLVRVTQQVDGDVDGHFEGTLSARRSFQGSQASPAGETIDLTIGTNVAGVNVATIPIVCMYTDDGSDFGPLNTTLSAAGDYTSSSIEADGDIGSDPTYDGPDWNDVSDVLTAGDVSLQVAKLIASAFDPAEAAVGAIIDLLGAAAEHCDSQASIFSIAVAEQSSGATTYQGYVASEQTSNGILTTATAQLWQQNEENSGGAVWQTSISDQYLSEMVNASGDNGLSLAGNPTSVGLWTMNTSWTFMINEGGSSSIPNGCDDKGC